MVASGAQVHATLPRSAPSGTLGSSVDCKWGLEVEGCALPDALRLDQALAAASCTLGLASQITPRPSSVRHVMGEALVGALLAMLWRSYM